MRELRIKETPDTDHRDCGRGVGETLAPLRFQCLCGYRISEKYHHIVCHGCNRTYGRNFDKTTNEWVITLTSKENIPSFPHE
jgi:hypothetical protein